MYSVLRFNCNFLIRLISHFSFPLLLGHFHFVTYFDLHCVRHSFPKTTTANEHIRFKLNQKREFSVPYRRKNITNKCQSIQVCLTR